MIHFCAEFLRGFKAEGHRGPEQPLCCEDRRGPSNEEDAKKAVQKSEKGTKSERRMPRLSGGDERRGKLRKGSGICKQELIRACLNGATHLVEDQVLS